MNITDNKYIDIAWELYEKVVEIRRHIHQRAELSFCEKETADYIASILDSEDIPYRHVAGTGILAEINGALPAKNDKVVVLRADIDALPIEESNELPYRCPTGAMHACGHDLHTAWLLGATIAINRDKATLHGKVLALFQPGEEKAPGGASYVLSEVDFKEYGSPTFIGQHVAPDIEAGKYGIRPGLYMASTDEIHIDIYGKGGHGALTDTFVDPVIAMASMILSMQQVVSRLAPSTIPTVLSFGQVIAGGATNVIPEKVEIHGTLRTFSPEWRANAKEKIREIAANIAQAHGCRAEVDIPDGYPSVINDEKIATEAIETLKSIAGEDSIKMLDLRMTGEDFGHYTTLFPSLFLRVGVGYRDHRSAGSLHSASFNPNEEALVYGMASMIALAYKTLE